MTEHANLLDLSHFRNELSQIGARAALSTSSVNTGLIRFGGAIARSASSGTSLQPRQNWRSAIAMRRRRAECSLLLVRGRT